MSNNWQEEVSYSSVCPKILNWFMKNRIWHSSCGKLLHVVAEKTAILSINFDLVIKDSGDPNKEGHIKMGTFSRFENSVIVFLVAKFHHWLIFIIRGLQIQRNESYITKTIDQSFWSNCFPIQNRYEGSKRKFRSFPLGWSDSVWAQDLMNSFDQAVLTATNIKAAEKNKLHVISLT